MKLSGFALAAILLGSAATSAAEVAADDVRAPSLEPLQRFGGRLAARLEKALAEVRRLDAGSGAAERRSERAEAHGRLGHLLHAYEYLALAETCYRNAATLEPGNPRWTYDLALAALDAADYDLATARFEQVRAQQPGDLATLLHLGTAGLRAARLETARAAFRDAVALDPESAAAHCGLGQLAIEDRAWPDAARELERCLELEPSAERVHAQLAIVYRRLGSDDLAARHSAVWGATEVGFDDPWRDEILREIGEEEILLQRAIERLNEGRPADAAPLVERLLTLDPENVGGLDLRAQLEAAHGDLATAAATLLRARELQPGSTERALRIADLLDRDGRPADAAVFYLEALDADPSNRPLAVAALDALTRAGLDERLEQVYTDVVLAQWPGDPDFRVAYGATLLRLRKLPQAAVELRRAIDSGAAFEDAFLLLAAALSRQSDVAGAIHSLEQGLIQNPESQILRDNLTRLLDATRAQLPKESSSR